MIAHGQDYGSLQMIGESCRASFAANSSGQAMVDQTFVLSSEPVEMIASNELSNWIKDSRKDYSAYLLNQRDLANRSTQIYLNQTLYNWMVFEKIFGNTSGPQIRPDVLNQPSTQSGLKTVLPIFETQKANLKSLQTKQALENEIEWINPIIMDLNKVCRKRHATYQVLNQAYRNKSMQNPQFNPQLQSILLPDGQPTVLSYNGDTDSLIHKRMQEERNSATHEASFYRYILSQSSFGYLLNTQTDLQNFVGNWNVRSCVEEGQELKTISLQAMTYISSSIEQVRKTYQSTVRRLSTIQQPKIIGEVVIQKTSQEIIEQFIQENPTSIQAAMLIHPNEQQALMVCSAIKNIQNTQDIQEAAIPLIVVGATVASAFVGPEAMLLINGAWLTSSASDVVQSYGMEKRINQAILSDQISVLFGQEIIRNIQSQRPLSYLNLALAGTGSAASIKSIQQKVKVRAYDEQLSVHGGSTQAKFNKVQTTKTISESKTTVEAAPGKQITLQEKAAIESWFKKQPNTSKGVVENGKTKTQNDLDLFNHDPDGNFGTIVQPKTPIPGGSKTIQNLLQDTGVTMHGKLGFIQPRMQGLSINRPSNSFEIQNQIRLDPISELSTFPMSVLNVQTVRSTIGSEEQLDDISQLKDLLDDLLSRDSDDLTKDEIDVLCNLLKNGIDPWLKILLDLVLDKYAAKLDCENMTKLMYVEKRSESFTPKVVVEYDHFKNINPLKLPIPFHYYSEAMQQLYEPRPIVLNQAETGVTESEPTAIPETKPDEEKPMPSLTPKQDGENQEQVPPGQANPPKLSSDKISMIPNRSLPPIPYAIPNGYVSYQSDVWMGDHISEEKLKEIQEAVEQFYKNQNGKSLFQRAMSWDMSLEVRAEMKRLDALCASDKENERPPRAICQFVAEYLRGNRGKQMLLFQDNGFNFSSNFDNQIAEIGLPMNLLNELKSMYPELSKQWENLINLHASSYFTDKNSAQKIHRLLYSLAETNKLSNQAQKYEYFHQVLKTGGTNVSSPLDVEIYKESQRTHTDLPVILDREQIKNIMEMLRKKPVRLNQDDRVVEYNLTEQNFIEEKVIFKNISINHEFVK